MRKITPILFLSLLFFSCKTSLSPTELYEKYKNSVVLIENSYYFKTSLDNDLTFFYTIENGDPVFYDSEEKAIDNAGIVFGTGFFISDKGELATNRHVIYPDKEYELVEKRITEFVNNLKYEIQKAINENQNEQNKLVEIYNDYFDYLDFSKKLEIKDEYSNKQNSVIELNHLLENLYFNPQNTRTELKRVSLGIAYNDTYVTSMRDFQECVPIKTNDDTEIDLAIIQLKNKTTPNSVNNTFPLKQENNIKDLKLNDIVYMIGFNHGIILANTENGIKSQFTQGTITQDPDKRKILYSIPTLPGSSGSPILDEWGNLVAINFAKIQNYQGFSFGIPSIELVSLYHNTNTPKKNITPIAEVKNPENQVPSTNNLDNVVNYYFAIRKAYFYGEPFENTIRKTYLVEGDKVDVLDIRNGFGYVEFTNTKGQKTKGWIRMSDLSNSSLNSHNRF